MKQSMPMQPPDNRIMMSTPHEPRFTPAPRTPEVSPPLIPEVPPVQG